MKSTNYCIALAMLFCANLSANEKQILGVELPTAKQMYVSCYLNSNQIVVGDNSIMESPMKCASVILQLITLYEGKGNNNSGNIKYNFCLPKTSDPSVIMKDAFFEGYELSLKSNNFDPETIRGDQFFLVLMIRKFPCENK